MATLCIYMEARLAVEEMQKEFDLFKKRIQDLYASTDYIHSYYFDENKVSLKNRVLDTIDAILQENKYDVLRVWSLYTPQKYDFRGSYGGKYLLLFTSGHFIVENVQRAFQELVSKEHLEEPIVIYQAKSLSSGYISVKETNGSFFIVSTDEDQYDTCYPIGIKNLIELLIHISK